jgi:SAM-dependent methyltransferase
LACPLCASSVADAPALLTCSGCGSAFPQPDRGMADLFPASWDPDRTRWRSRQHAMDDDYRALVADTAHLELGYQLDLGAFASRLAACQGRVLDVGGGNGVLRHFLPREVEYVSLDPSTVWLESRWRAMLPAFPCLAQPLRFVRGTAEHLPFATGLFDWVTSFWSLNHTADPAAALAQMSRVLRPGGRLLLVLEDAQPTWDDVWSGAYVDHRSSQVATLARRALAPVVGWPLQADHIRVSEDALSRSSANALIRRRRDWSGVYLTLEFERRG